MKTIVVDIDGTLAYSPGYKDLTNETWCWEKFKEEIQKAECNSHLRQVINDYSLLNLGSVVILTARPFFLYLETRDWLQKHLVKYDSLIMADEDSYKQFEDAREFGYEHVQYHQAMYKQDRVTELKEKGHIIEAAYEDNLFMTKALRSMGVNVYQVEFKGKQ